MAYPPDIRDALESVVELFFSGVVHRERATFILCDTLVEAAFKRKAKQLNHQFDTSQGFHGSGVDAGFSEQDPLFVRVKGYRDERNSMQHEGAGLTVSDAHCADAILDTWSVMQHLWGTHALSQRMGTALRLVRVVSTRTDLVDQEAVEDSMSRRNWLGLDSASRPTVRETEVSFEPGRRANWTYALRYHYTEVDACLGEHNIPQV